MCVLYMRVCVVYVCVCVHACIRTRSAGESKGKEAIGVDLKNFSVNNLNSRKKSRNLPGIGKGKEGLIIGDPQTFVKLGMQGMKRQVGLMTDENRDKKHYEVTGLRGGRGTRA